MRNNNQFDLKKHLATVGLVSALALFQGCGGAPDTSSAGSSSSSSGSMAASSSSGTPNSPDPLPEVKFVNIPGTNVQAPETSCATIEATPDSIISRSQFSHAISHTFAPLNLDVSAELERISWPKTHQTNFLFAIEKVADQVADEVVAGFDQLGLACSQGKACAEAFVEKYARLALRGSLDQAEIDLFIDELFTPAADFNEGIAQLTRGILLHPGMLLRYEQGIEGGGGTTVLTPLDKATKLSLMLWDSIPDEALLDAAENGSLNSEAGFRAEVQRMLSDQRFDVAVQHFHHHWLEIGDGKAIAGYDSAVGELDRLLPQMYRNGSKISDLFTTNKVIVNKELADIYGVTNLNGLTNDTWKETTIDHRPGILTRAGFLLGTSVDPVNTSPTERGLIIANNVLCAGAPEEAPDDLQDSELIILKREPNLTTRQEVEKATAIGVCHTCHVTMDPLGFALEKFDGSGRFRETEDGLAIDDIADSPLIGTIDGPSGFANLLSVSDQAQSCYTRQWFQRAYNLDEVKDENCAFRELETRVLNNGGDLIQMITELVNNPALHYRAL